jgi:hypothetical protein
MGTALSFRTGRALMRMVGRYHLGSEEDKLVVDPTLSELFRSTIHEALERGADNKSQVSLDS